MKSLKLLENGIFELVFANTVFYKSAILLIHEIEFIESVLNMFSYQSNLRAFKTKGHSRFDSMLFAEKETNVSG